MTGKNNDLNEFYQEKIDNFKKEFTENNIRISTLENHIRGGLEILLMETCPDYNLISELDKKPVDLFSKNDVEMKVDIQHEDGLKVFFTNPKYYGDHEISSYLIENKNSQGVKKIIGSFVGSDIKGSKDSSEKMNVTDVFRLKSAAITMTADSIDGLQRNPTPFIKIMSEYKKLAKSNKSIKDSINIVKIDHLSYTQEGIEDFIEKNKVEEVELPKTKSTRNLPFPKI
jgi:hypothetical protein